MKEGERQKEKEGGQEEERKAERERRKRGSHSIPPACVHSAALELEPEMGSGLSSASWTLDTIISCLALSSRRSVLLSVLFNVPQGESKCLPSSQFQLFIVSTSGYHRDHRFRWILGHRQQDWWLSVSRAMHIPIDIFSSIWNKDLDVLICVCVCSVMSNSLLLHELLPTRLLCLRNSPVKNAGVDSHFLLLGIWV